MHLGHDYIIQNPKFIFCWAGWQAPGYDLQRSGWDISIEQSYEVMGGSFRFYLRWNPRDSRGQRGAPITAISEHISSDQFVRFEEHNPQAPHVRIQAMANEIRMDIRNLEDIKPMADLAPYYTSTIDLPPGPLDQKIFRTLDEINEIVVVEQDTRALLAKIIENQDPKQKEIRKKYRRDWRNSEKELSQYKTIGQIVTIN